MGALFLNYALFCKFYQFLMDLFTNNAQQQFIQPLIELSYVVIRDKPCNPSHIPIS